MRVRSGIMVSMNRLSTEKRVRVVASLIEGNSIRATVRMTGVAKNTVTKLLVDLGAACDAYMHEVMRDLPCERLQVDEIWAFVYSKQKNVPEERIGEYGIGDVWTYVAIDPDTKLVPAWLVGERNADDATVFLGDLKERLRNRVQLTTDGNRAYLSAVPTAFRGEIDWAVLQKIYGSDPDAARRYSPAKCTGIVKDRMLGNPDPAHVNTSYVERQNLTMRMGMRRFTRLTNAFSKKVENLNAAVALHFMHYNFVRRHQTLKTTPAVAAGVADHEWTLEEIVGLLDAN